MDSTLLWLFLSSGFFLIFLEFLLPGLIVCFLGLAALSVAASIYFGFVSEWISTLLLFFILSVLYLILLRSMVLKALPSQTQKGDPDDWSEAMGAIVEVTEEMKAGHEGRIKYAGSYWRAEIAKSGFPGDRVVRPGERVKIVGRRGSLWLVERLPVA